ncbi:MAG: magnesium transporter, partial [Oceanospirillum sp.]|nr:magnesium transporter [Oceanospirillum sp.]
MASENQDIPPMLERLTNAMDSGSFAQVRRMLNRGLPAQDVAHLLESSPPKERDLLWNLIEPEFQGDVLQHLV